MIANTPDLLMRIEEATDRINDPATPASDALSSANETADLVVAAIGTLRQAADDPTAAADIYRQIHEMASGVAETYAAAATRFERTSKEGDALRVASAYWETRASSAAIEIVFAERRAEVETSLTRSPPGGVRRPPEGASYLDRTSKQQEKIQAIEAAQAGARPESAERRTTSIPPVALQQDRGTDDPGREPDKLDVEELIDRVFARKRPAGKANKPRTPDRRSIGPAFRPTKQPDPDRD